ncbi:MAG: DUF6282 family protein [Chloroflexota bacterium]
MGLIEDLLTGSIDMHIHASPDPRAERRVDAIQAARQAQEAGMRAIVLKSHEYPTAPLARIVGQMVPGLTVVGAIALDYEVGGLNPHALTASAKMGAKIVWMPTICSAHDMKRKKPPEEGISLFDDRGKLLPVVDELLEIVKSYDMVLATGHISPEEAFALVDRARQVGIEKIVITHPLLEWIGCHLTLEEQKQMVAKGAIIEHCFGDTMPLHQLNPRKIVEVVKAVGAEHCILSTDLGQNYNPAPAEGMRVAIATLLLLHLSEKDIEFMIKTNPARLLGLD